MKSKWYCDLNCCCLLFVVVAERECCSIAKDEEELAIATAVSRHHTHDPYRIYQSWCYAERSSWDRRESACGWIDGWIVGRYDHVLGLYSGMSSSSLREQIYSPREAMITDAKTWVIHHSQSKGTCCKGMVKHSSHVWYIIRYTFYHIHYRKWHDTSTQAWLAY